MDKAIECITKWCHHCASPLNYPHTAVEQSTTAPPDAVGMSFAADVIKRNRQLILVVREYVTSSKTTTLLEDERHQSLRGALVKLCIESRPLDSPQAVTRTDPVPWFKALPNYVLLRSHRLSIEIGRVKNNNKIPIAKRAVQKLEHEHLWQKTLNGRTNGQRTVTQRIQLLTLTKKMQVVATDHNNEDRHAKLSARTTYDL